MIVRSLGDTHSASKAGGATPGAGRGYARTLAATRARKRSIAV